MPPKRKSAEESLCHRCQRPWRVDEFYKIENKRYPSGLTHLCKQCIDDVLKENLKRYDSMEASMFFLCSMMDVPFVRRVYEAFEKKIVDKDVAKEKYFGIYLNQLNIMRKKTDKWEDFSSSDVELGQIKKLRKHEAKLEEEVEELRLVWGEKTIEQLQFLEYRFTVWTDGLELAVSQEKLYRDLSLLELKQRELDDKCEDTKNVQAQILSIMKILKIDQFKEKKEETLVERMLESRIAVQETTDPAFHYKDLQKYTDFKGFGEYFENHIKRPFRNFMLGSKEYHINPDDKIIPPNSEEED